MRKDIVGKVSRFYKERLDFYAKLRRDALSSAHSNDEICSIAKRIKEIKLLAIQGKLDEDIDREYDTLSERLTLLLKDYMPKINYECDICKDKGVVNGKYCKCFMTRYMNEVKKLSNISSLPTFTFDDNDIDSYALDEENMNRYKATYKLMSTFADKYPDTKKFNIFLKGQSGCGKTCLVSAIANRLIEKGMMVEYITAFDLGELMLKNYLDYKENSLSIITSADILIIDDLGSEPMRNNINTTYLQSILDSRIASRKSTIVTTNLNAEQLMKKYGERVISRLLNKNDTISIDFESMPNLRTTKKG